MIYFDNAATSWPTPPCVMEALAQFLQNCGANPGRSGHRLAIDAARIVYNTREAIAKLFNVSDPLRIIFTMNVTEAINLALRGYVQPGDNIITSSMEHNSMMRPLRDLEKTSVQLKVVQCSQNGKLDVDDVKAAIQSNTVMIAINHASNVVGTLQSLSEIGKVARNHNVLLLVDAAQTGGAYPIDMISDNIDLLAFTGHKSLYGPTGTGGLIINERVDINRLKPLKTGGTGSGSEKEHQPQFLPDKYESGTPNVVGLAGLGAALHWISQQDIKNIRSYELKLTAHLISGLQQIRNVKVYGCLDAAHQTATVSFNIDGLQPSEVGLKLDEQLGIMCRVGLHCSPASHNTICTFPNGTIRFGLGFFNTLSEVDAALSAVKQIAKVVS